MRRENAHKRLLPRLSAISTVTEVLMAWGCVRPDRESGEVIPGPFGRCPTEGALEILWESNQLLDARKATALQQDEAIQHRMKH